MGAPGTVEYVFQGKGDGEDGNYINSLEDVLRMGEELLMERLLAKLQAEYEEVALWEGKVLFKLGEDTS